MEDKISIAELLLKHHSYIEALYEDFKKKNLGTDYDVIRESFNILEQNLKKHLSTEEDTIFKFCDLSSKTVTDSIHTLITQHFTIREMLNTIRRALESGAKIDISGLDKLLISHKNFEDWVFYPKLDEELDEPTKKGILDGICALERPTSLKSFK